MKKSIFSLFLAIMLVQTAWALAPVTDDVLDLYARAARIAVRRLPQLHLNHHLCNDFIATNALERFLSTLDFDHSYFLAADVEKFREEAVDLDNQLIKGNLEFSFKVHDILMTRISNRVAYVDALLDQGFDLTVDETYRWNRRDAPWPADEKAWDDLWRQKIKNIYVGRIAAKTLAEEKKAREETENADADIEDTDKPDNGEKLSEDPESSSPEVEEEDTDEADDLFDLSPEAFIRKQFKQLYTVLNDNDANWLLPLYISSFTRIYDPHSDYMSANNTEDFDIHMKLSLVGIGALLSTEDGAAKVVRLIPGGPAEQDGRLRAGDKIIAVAQGDEEAVDVLHWPLSKTVRLIRGEKNTKVVLTLIPSADISGTTIKRIDLIRDEVKLEESAAKGSVRAVNGLQVGLITIPEFYADLSGQKRGNKEARSLSKDVRKILDDLSTNHIQGIILDLRNNGGGPLYEACELSGLFIKKGPIVQVKSSQGISVLRDPDPALVYDGPLIVMVNRQSASASEILAAALKDYGRAVIVGDARTHGKGTVQSLINLQRSKPELGSLKLTTASFYRIAGGSTQIEGVQPDIHISSILDYLDVGEEYLPHALPWSLIKPTKYTRYDHLEQRLPELKQRSEERRNNDPKFAAYEELLSYLGEKRQNKWISLRIDDRLARARKEDKMADFFNEEDSDDKDEEEKNNDLVLDETFLIMADLISLTGKQNIQTNSPGKVVDIK